MMIECMRQINHLGRDCGSRNRMVVMGVLLLWPVTVGRGMGRKTKTLLAIILALTCSASTRKYADRSDQDPSTLFQYPSSSEDPTDSDSHPNNPFQSTAAAGGEREDLASISGFRRAPYRNEVGKVRPGKLKRRLSGLINFKAKYEESALFKTDDNEDSSTNMNTDDEEDDITSLPFIDNPDSSDTTEPPRPLPDAHEAAPLKGILRRGPRRSPETSPTKRVAIKKRPKIILYDPNGPVMPVEKCGGEDTIADVDMGVRRREEERYRPRTRDMKPSNTIKQNLRHLFYQ